MSMEMTSEMSSNMVEQPRIIKGTDWIAYVMKNELSVKSVEVSKRYTPALLQQEFPSEFHYGGTHYYGVMLNKAPLTFHN